ncbi:MAG: hypothetical protein JW812_00565 [Alphaproteobacteria bacterium]|nr:hypothetical protein [Alphaproteobacteria bacterium]MBN2779707.1 hypothetical protein [Alphaproteobacteria bacterium]
MMLPIFPFKVHLKNRPARRSIRLLRWIAFVLTVLFTINALIGFGFLTLLKQKELSPRFVSFDSKLSSFRLFSADSVPGKVVKSARDVLREKFVRDYVLKREMWQLDMANNHHRLCDCLQDEREKKLIEKTRNRTVEPRCSVCLMSTQAVFKDFFDKTYPARKERSKDNWVQLPSIRTVELYKIIPPERGKGLTLIYKIDYEIEDQLWQAYVSVRDLLKPDEYLFQVVDYGILPSPSEK